MRESSDAHDWLTCEGCGRLSPVLVADHCGMCNWERGRCRTCGLPVNTDPNIQVTYHAATQRVECEL